MTEQLDRDEGGNESYSHGTDYVMDKNLLVHCTTLGEGQCEREGSFR